MAQRQNKRLGIYVHVPFCRHKCAYCDFYSYCPRDARVYAAYVDALLSHMKSYKTVGADYMPDTVYIGGGTPTVLPPEELLRLIRGIKSSFRLSKNVEFSMECNPATAGYEDLRRYRRAGVNRLSIGLQSVNTIELSALGRIHSARDFGVCFRDARRAGFDNINIDLMFGIPYQTLDSWAATLKFAVSRSPEHISLYDLKLEPGTPLCDNASAFVFPDEDAEYAMYTFAIEFLERAGYRQYEISNFARPGKECRHNLKYWRCEEYLGFGPSAHSYFTDVRFSFKPSVSNYIKCISGRTKDEMTDDYEEIPLRERLGEYIMLRMRLTEGVDSREFMRTFGKDFGMTYGAKLKKYIEGGYMSDSGGYYRFTPAGMFVSNYILSDILEFDADGHFAM